MSLIDSHAHLTDERFADDLGLVLERAAAAGIEAIITVATSVAGTRDALTLAERVPGIYATAGVHPHQAAEALDADWAALPALLRDERVVAVGEAGLDFFYDNAPRAVQRKAFERQLGLAADHDLPIVVHARNADDETAAAIRAHPRARGVLHCFTGGGALLDVALEAGWSISFTGIVTFGRFDGEELVLAVPADRLMIETDSPYLAPVPHRGRRNEPAWVAAIADRLAQIRNVPADELQDVTTRNAREFFRIPRAAAPLAAPAAG